MRNDMLVSSIAYRGETFVRDLENQRDIDNATNRFSLVSKRELPLVVRFLPSVSFETKLTARRAANGRERMNESGVTRKSIPVTFARRISLGLEERPAE